MYKIKPGRILYMLSYTTSPSTLSDIPRKLVDLDGEKEKILPFWEISFESN